MGKRLEVMNGRYQLTPRGGVVHVSFRDIFMNDSLIKA